MTTDSDPATRLHEFEQRLADAEGDLRTAEVSARQAQDRLPVVNDELGALSASAPDQFKDDDTPRPKTQAAKLAAERAALLTPAVPPHERIRAAEQRVRVARHDLDAYRAEHVEELFRDEVESEAKAWSSQWERALDIVEGLVGQHFTLERKSMALLSGVQGLDGQDLPSSERISQFHRAVKKFRASGPVRAPLPRSLYPAEGELPPKVRGEGGFISRHSYEVGQEQERKRARKEQATAAQTKRLADQAEQHGEQVAEEVGSAFTRR